MEDFLRYLITPLLSNPELLEIKVTGAAIFVKVGDEDTGKIIGKHGHVINSLRTLLKTYCTLRQEPLVTLSLTTPPAPKKD